MKVADNEAKFAGLLEKKWTSVVRLQRKLLDLEVNLAVTMGGVVYTNEAPVCARRRTK